LFKKRENPPCLLIATTTTTTNNNTNDNDNDNDNKKTLAMAQYEVKEYSQQSGYIPQPAMSIPQTQPQVVTRNQGRGTWKASLFDCFSVPGLCLKTCFCPCITYVSLILMCNYLGFSIPLITFFSNTIHYRAKQKRK